MVSRPTGFEVDVPTDCRSRCSGALAWSNLRSPDYASPMARHKSFRSQLYRAARDLGNVQAADKGPGFYAKRVARRQVYRSTNGLTRKVLRGFGL